MTDTTERARLSAMSRPVVLDELVDAGNKLSIAAQTACGTAGRDGVLVAAIDKWADAVAALAAMPQPTSTVEAGDALREAREALEEIAVGSRLVIEMFERRVKERKGLLTWYAANVMQDNLAGYEGTARAALAKLDTAEKGDGE